jgi:hypothetical protein
MSINPSDVLVAIAHYLPRGRRSFIYPSGGFYTFFQIQKEKHPQTLSQLSFNNSDIFTQSEELQQAVTNLIASGMLIWSTKAPQHYHFSQDCEKSFEKFVSKRLCKRKLSEIEAIAQEFDSSIALPVAFRT